MKYGQTRVTSDAQMPLVVVGGAADRSLQPAPWLGRGLHASIRRSLRQGQVTLHGAGRAAARAIRGSLATERLAEGRGVHHRFPDAWEPSSTAETVRDDSAYCCT